MKILIFNLIISDNGTKSRIVLIPTTLALDATSTGNVFLNYMNDSIASQYWTIDSAGFITNNEYNTVLSSNAGESVFLGRKAVNNPFQKWTFIQVGTFGKFKNVKTDRFLDYYDTTGL